jgi:hypothetical protein
LSPSLYFEKVLSLINKQVFNYTDQLSIAGRSVKLHTASSSLRDKFLPSLAHLIDEGEIKDPDLTIWYLEDQHLLQKLKAPPWPGFNAQGFNSSICEDDVQIFFQPWQTQIFLYSRSNKTGIYWVRKAEDVPWWECTFSFRIIFHFWTSDLPAQLVHAGAMAKNEIGVLIPGQSGSGKSTSCLNLLRAGYDYLGDDYVWVEMAEQVKVFSLYQTAKVEPENFENRFSDWKKYVQNKADYQQQKAIFHVKDMFPEAAISATKITAILLPKVAHQEKTVFRRAGSMHALMAMAPTTLHHLPHNRENSYKKMVHISSMLPAYHWNLGHDLKHFIESFSNFIANELVES